MKNLISTLILCFISLTLLKSQTEAVAVCAQIENDGTDTYAHIVAQNFENIGGFQFGVAWKTSEYNFLEIENIHPAIPGTASNNVDDNIPGGVTVLRLLWLDFTSVEPATVDDNTTLFTIKLESLDPSGDNPIGIVPTDNLEIEFISGQAELLDYVIDDEGCSTVNVFSLSSNENVLINNLSLSPNPFNQEIVVQLEELNSGTFSIYSVAGKLMSQHVFTNEQEVKINTENLEAGSYILTQQSSDGQILGQSKIVKL